MNCRSMLSKTVFPRLVGTRQRAKRTNCLKKTAKRLAAYSAAAAATFLTSQGSANAAEVVHDITDVTVAGNGILFNVITGSTTAAAATQFNSEEGSFRLGSAFFDGFLELAGPANSAGAGFVSPSDFGDGYRYASLLSLSSSVGTSKNFGGRIDFPSYGIYAFLSDFVNTSGFVGLRFNIGGTTHFGWADVSGVGGGQTLHGFGYNNTPGAASHPVNTVVPEPSSVLLLATGAAGLGMWRRRRSNA